jgi:hypothetical protein
MEEALPVQHRYYQDSVRITMAELFSSAAAMPRAWPNAPYKTNADPPAKTHLAERGVTVSHAEEIT